MTSEVLELRLEPGVEGVIRLTAVAPTQLTFALSATPAAAEAGAIVVTAARVKATQLEIGPGTSFTQQVLQAAPTFDRDIRDVIKMDPRVSLDRQDVSTGGSGGLRYAFAANKPRLGFVRDVTRAGAVVGTTGEDLRTWLALDRSAYWVNLNLNEPDRITDRDLGKTHAGRALLEADLQLERTSSN